MGGPVGKEPFNSFLGQGYVWLKIIAGPIMFYGEQWFTIKACWKVIHSQKGDQLASQLWACLDDGDGHVDGGGDDGGNGDGDGDVEKLFMDQKVSSLQVSCGLALASRLPITLRTSLDIASLQVLCRCHDLILVMPIWYFYCCRSHRIWISSVCGTTVSSGNAAMTEKLYCGRICLCHCHCCGSHRVWISSGIAAMTERLYCGHFCKGERAGPTSKKVS